MLIKSLASSKILFRNKYIKYLIPNKQFNNSFKLFSIQLSQISTISSFKFRTNNKNKNNQVNYDLNDLNNGQDSATNSSSINNEEVNEIEYHTPSETLVFNNGKCLIVDSDDKHKSLIKFFTNALILANSLFGYKFISHVYYYHPFKAVIWGIPFLLVLKVYRGLSINKTLMIISIYLLKDGKSLEIQLDKKKLQVQIGEIKVITFEEGKLLQKTHSKSLFIDYFPVKINKILYLLPRNLAINNKEILAAIMAGKYINLDEGKNQINKEDVIDI